MEKKISKTQIEKRMQVKTDSTLKEAIIKLKKTNPVVAKELAKPKRQWASVNLDAIAKISGDVVVAGKVLGSGHLEKAKKIVGWGASAKAVERIKSAGGSFVSILDEIKKNAELKGLELVK
jgi:ribosomal protein L18E